MSNSESILAPYVDINLIRLEEAMEKFFSPTNLMSRTLSITPYGLAPWSASKIKLLSACPLQFFLHYILKFKIEGPEDPDDTLRRNVGTTGHYIIEKMIDGYTTQQAYDLAKTKYYDLVTPTRWFHVDNLMPNIRAFNRRLFDLEERIDVVEADSEKMLAVDKDFRPVSFNSDKAFLRGIIDLAMRTDTNDSIQIDHKYGGTSAWGLANYRLQLHVCKVLEHFGSEDPIRGVQSGIHFMENGQVAMDPYVSRMMVEVGLTKWILDAINKLVLEVIQDGKFRHKRGHKCKYCPYESMCKNGPRGTAGQLSFVVNETEKLF